MKTINITISELADYIALENKLDLCLLRLNEVLLVLAKLEKRNSGEISSDTNDKKKSDTFHKAPLHSGMKLIGIGDDSLLLNATPEEKNSGNGVGQFKCLPLQPDLDPLEISQNSVDPSFFSDAILEHPAIPGLLLSLEERQYGGYLEYLDGSGEKQTETIKQRPFRRKWKKPIPMSVSPSDHHFTNLNPALFPVKKR